MQSFARGLARYALTGGAAAVVDIGGFACLSMTPIPTVLAATSSFLVATVVNFLLTSRFVFRATATVRRYFAFLGGSLLSLLVNVSSTSVGVILLSVPRMEAKAVAVAATFALSFWINARFVFTGGPNRGVVGPPAPD